MSSTGTQGQYAAPRLTQFAAGGGCACKIPPGLLESLVSGLPSAAGAPGAAVLVGTQTGDDAGVVQLREDLAVISTADFFTPVVDDPYDFGRIAAANALSDVYAMGGRPVMAVNLVGWPRATLSEEALGAVLRGGADMLAEAGCPLVGGHSIDDPEPKYGLAVTGVAHPDQLLRNDTARPGLPLTLTKPLGIGVLGNWHKQTGQQSPAAIEAMTTLNAAAAEAALAAGLRTATDVTGFGLLGHLHKMMRASGTTARLDAAAVPYLEGARQAAADGFISGGTRRNLEWVSPHLGEPDVDEVELLLLADAQTSGGLLLVGEVDLPGAVVIGEVMPGRGEHTVEITSGS
ncbi:selenide, water dikinase SelD [Ornithinimicrobium cryptoxanthini]|uniref:Selenide, water dikinase n=1 Tax=Ornithinimicrobium cryptoxanthini TaxID=2934161 RepID=A0ABY4YEW8_9MICO|nr:selenide, water dikinase SelD [Ornithinimicrobium cryptoxanthini]USQ75307.1 selenide, water dikinase SelD [Ornithinimicrobium cryptoxanthini]